MGAWANVPGLSSFGVRRRYSISTASYYVLTPRSWCKPCQPHLVGSDQNEQAKATGVQDLALHHRCVRRNRRSPKYLVPNSIVYDQLHEVEAATTEAYGCETTRTCAFWSGWRDSGRRAGYLDFGEPLPLLKRLQEMRRQVEAPATRSGGSRWCRAPDQPPPVAPHRGGESGPAGRGPLVVHQRGVGDGSPVGQLPQLGGGRRRRSRQINDDPVDLASDGCFSGGECLRRGYQAVWGIGEDQHLWRFTATPRSIS